MKKAVLVAIAVFSFLCSCSKQYTCTCAITGTVDVEVYQLYNTKKKAIQYCNGYSSEEKQCVLEIY
jgi:hypothetical protein